MLNSQDLISTLKSQHRILESDLLQVSNEAKSEAGSVGEAIVLGLTKFKKDLGEHLELENGAFYPDYLDKKIKRGEDTASTKEFIEQMNGIGKTVMDFLGKFNTPQAVDNEVVNFINELSKIIGVLKIRIETEEEGVFELYLLM